MNTPNTPTAAAAKHTPAPWKLIIQNPGTAWTIGTDAGAICDGWGPGSSIDDANAEHILRCVNEHDALIAVAEAAEQARNAIRLCGLGGKSLGLEKRVEKSLESTLANLADVRGR